MWSDAGLKGWMDEWKMKGLTRGGSGYERALVLRGLPYMNKCCRRRGIPS